jgi:hypothetical protein
MNASLMKGLSTVLMILASEIILMIPEHCFSGMQ